MKNEKISRIQHLFVLKILMSFNLVFAQNKILSEIKSYNEEGNYQKSQKLLIKYKDKNRDTINVNYLICLSDYYSTVNNIEYNPLKAISIINEISCEKIKPENLGIFFKDNEECFWVIKEKKDKYVGLYFEAIFESNDIDSLKSFNKEFPDYIEMTNKISEKIITIKFNVAKISNSKEELMKFQNEFANSQYEQEVLSLIEEFDYTEAISLNTIDSYSRYLKSYPKSNKYELIQSKLEGLTWEKCIQINTKESFQMFINTFPNSSKMAEAKMKISKFIEIADLSKVNSYTSLSLNKKMFEPFSLKVEEFEDRDFPGSIMPVRFLFLELSNNGQIALAINEKDEGKAYLINILSGYIFYQFEYKTIENYIFNTNDTKLFFYDNKFIKQIDLTSLEITNLFEVEQNGRDQNIILDNNNLHFCIDIYDDGILHYKYNLFTSTKEIEIISTRTIFKENLGEKYSDFSIRGNIQKEYNSIFGSTEQKILTLKLIYGDKIQIKPLTKNSNDEYLVVSNFNGTSEKLTNSPPEVFILKHNIFTIAGSIELYKTNQITKREEYINESRYGNNHYFKMQLTENNELLYIKDQSLFILRLDAHSNGKINLKHVDPVEIRIGFDKTFMFARFDSNSDRLYYQVSKDERRIGNRTSEVYVHSIENNLIRKDESKMKDLVIKQLLVIDETLKSYYDSKINTETVKNQLLESDVEKYYRIQNINSQITPIFNKIRDSLFHKLNKIIEDSIKVYNYEAEYTFDVQNYDQSTEAWLLFFKNPYNGKNFSIIYPQSKSEAKLNLSKKFSNINIEVKFYFNLISLTFEPLIVSIFDTYNNNSERFIIPFKDLSLLKNLYLTNNYYTIDYSGIGFWGDLEYEGFDLTVDENIIKYFISIGKPKFYFNYGQVDDYGREISTDVSVRSIDDVNINYNFQDEYLHCCPIPQQSQWNYESYNYQFLRFNNVPYFIDQSPLIDKTNVFELNKKSSLGVKDDVNYPNGESPNGKFIVNNTGVYKKGSNICLLKIQNAVGKVYWDCNSYYFGIGSDVFPVTLLEKVLKQ